MCVTLARARLSATILYAAEVSRGGDILHVLGYQNRVQNLAGNGRPAGNAIILPIPAVPKTMTRQNVVETEQCPHILEDVAEAVRRQESELSRTKGMKVLSASAVEVFDTGIYTVVLAQDARDIPAALGMVPPLKRPALNPPIFDAYAVWYPGWTVALCCFNNADAAKATPLLWWYQPANPGELFAAALDCHSGAVPDLRARVTVDHTVAVGSHLIDQDGFWQRTRGKKLGPALESVTRVRFQDAVPAQVRPFLCDHAVGSVYHGTMPNGDFVCSVEKLRKGPFGGDEVLQRVPPPGAQATA
jgi:hypothetical protein